MFLIPTRMYRPILVQLVIELAHLYVDDPQSRESEYRA